MKVRQKGNRGEWIARIAGILALLLVVCGCSLQSSSTDPKSTTPTPTASRPTPTVTAPLRVESTNTAPLQTPPGDWPSYLMNAGRSSFNGNETLINPGTASMLKRIWTYHVNAAISVQPVEFYGLIYWGSWDGFEHATNLSGRQVWATRIGTTTDNDCNPSSAGVASTATVATVKIGRVMTPVVFVGGGDAFFYALNAFSGKIIWKTRLGDSPAHFIWGSPLFYKGNIYIGMASFGDCPTIQGALIQLNAINGAIKNTFAVVPSGCRGGSVWSSPTIDDISGNLYISTGNPDPCWTKENLVASVIELRASDLSYIDSWQVPPSESVIDNDFGATPTLFTARIGGVRHAMLGLAHKNGIYYAFDRNAIGNGPLWALGMAYGGSDPESGQGSISPSAWDGKRLYVAGGGTIINGVSCAGSVRALDPASGNILWQHCLTNGPVLGAVTAVPGLVVVAEGRAFDVLSAATGKTAFVYVDTHNYSTFSGPAIISNGVLYIGNMDGNLYAFGLIPQYIKRIPR